MKLFALLISMFLVATTGAGAQDWAKAKLEKSPRHHDWATVKNGERNVKLFVVYPEVKNKAPVILLIRENAGLTEWVRSMADQLAEAGYIVVAPDILDGKTYPSLDDARKATAALSPDQVTGDLNAAAAYAQSLPSASKKMVVLGFCWGGTQAFRYATNNKKSKAFIVFYGTQPEHSDMERISAPVYGFYGSDDARVTSTVETTAKQMKELGKKFFPETYAGAGHAFMRTGEEPNAKEANKKARAEAWERLLAVLKKTTK